MFKAGLGAPTQYNIISVVNTSECEGLKHILYHKIDIQIYSGVGTKSALRGARRARSQMG